VAIPTDEASCVAWHEADVDPNADTTAVEGFAGVGGMPWGMIQETPAERPTLVTLGGGRRAYRFDDTDDWLDTSAVFASNPFTVIAVFASRSTALGKRVLCGSGASNWLLGPRSEVGGDFASYAGDFIDSAVPADTAIHVHSVRQRTSGTLRDYRIDGAAVGTSGSAGAVGRVRVGGSAIFAGETANCDLIGFAAFNTDLSDGALAPQEAYMLVGGGGALTPGYNRLTQLPLERALEGGFLRGSQLAVEQSYEAGMIRDSQLLKELTYEAGGVRASQLLIELASLPANRITQACAEVQMELGSVRFTQLVMELMFSPRTNPFGIGGGFDDQDKLFRRRDTTYAFVPRRPRR
jgi:hypothetical protein